MTYLRMESLLEKNCDTYKEIKCEIPIISPLLGNKSEESADSLVAGERTNIQKGTYSCNISDHLLFGFTLSFIIICSTGKNPDPSFYGKSYVN